jgi:hypothetical protein
MRYVAGGDVGSLLRRDGALPIRAVLDGALPPPGWVGSGDATAFDVFAGYIMLDAWIANTDRHPHNWAVLRRATSAEPLQLCGSYDHASCLGFGVLDSK